MKIFMTKKDVATMLGVSISTINRWVFEKQYLPFNKIGGRIFFQKEDIDEFIQKGRVTPLE